VSTRPWRGAGQKPKSVFFFGFVPGVPGGGGEVGGNAGAVVDGAAESAGAADALATGADDSAALGSEEGASAAADARAVADAGAVALERGCVAGDLSSDADSDRSRASLVAVAR
jgi:hypothetical protein